MSLVQGADSAVPQPALYTPTRQVWGVYAAGDTPHVWTRDEVSALGRGGGKAVLPIVVPTQNLTLRWWVIDETGGYAYLESLVRDAVEWGCSPGTPLALDIEEAMAEAMGASCATVGKAFAAACGAHSLVPWLYGGETLHQYTEGGPCLRFLAKWDGDGTLPPGFHAKQYEGGAEGDRIDLDVFEGGRAFLGCDFQRVVIGEPDPVPEVAETTEPASEPGEAPATTTAEAEVPAVESAISAEVATEKADNPPSPTVAERLRQHAAELVTLATELEASKS